MAFSAASRCPSSSSSLCRAPKISAISSSPPPPSSVCFRSSPSSINRQKFPSIPLASLQASGEVAPATAISLTDNALKHLNKMRAERNEDLFLRIGVKQGGCSGMSYTMEFESRENARPDDSVIEYNGFVIEKRISKFISEKLVILLFGSFVCWGGLRVGPAVAQPVQESSGIEAGQQKAEAQSGGSEEMIYVKLLEKDPRDVEALKMIVNVMMKKGKTKEAVKYVERLIEVQPREVEWRLLQAFCYEIMGHLTKAKRLFKEILKQEPLLLRALHGLAMVMHKNLEGPAVFEMLNGALEVAHREKIVNKERNIKILIAQMHVVKGELEEALEKFQILVQENPRDFRPYLCQGIVYSLLDKKKEAEEQFEIYRNLVPEEFPGRGFLDDVMMAAKTESKEQLEKEFKAEYSYSCKS